MSVSYDNTSILPTNPTKLALVAMDWPNVWHRLREADRDIHLPFLLKGLKLDAAERLMAPPQAFSFEAIAFVQQLPEGDERPVLHRALSQVLAMQAAGWRVVRKLRPPDPIEERALVSALASAMDAPEQRRVDQLTRLVAYQDWDRLRGLAETILVDSGAYATKGQLRTLRTRPKQMGQHNNAHWDILITTCLAVSMLSLVALRRSQRPCFAGILSEMDQISLFQGIIFSLDRVDDDRLPARLMRLRDAANQALRIQHHRDDIDLMLTDWVHQHFVGHEADSREAVVYLVGDDYLNTLPAVERLQRYGVEPVLVISRAKLYSANRSTRRALERHSIIWLESFFTITEKRMIAG